MPLPLVSVVIPIFNQAKFVVETVGSAVRQTYRNLQVIVVDDGSTDNGPELLEAEFGEQIVLLRQKNAGPSAAINTGLAAATGLTCNWKSCGRRRMTLSFPSLS